MLFLSIIRIVCYYMICNLFGENWQVFRDAFARALLHLINNYIYNYIIDYCIYKLIL
jgi:hypothetical protein